MVPAPSDEDPPRGVAAPAPAAAPVEPDREQMLATLSHDLRNPLSAILVGAQNIIRMQAPDDVTPRLRRYAQAIQRAGQRMNDLLRDLLDLTRLELGTLELVQTVRPAAELVAVALAPLHEAATAKRIAIRTSIPEALAVRCDDRRAAQVIGNVVGNAMKFCPEDTVVEVSAELRGTSIAFTVRDNGPGIIPEELPKVLGPYWQSADNPRRGMGVGLPLAKAIVEAHGGSISVDSGAAGGTTVSFTFPAAP
jgi:signal transduction histidine kinase